MPCDSLRSDESSPGYVMMLYSAVTRDINQLTSSNMCLNAVQTDWKIPKAVWSLIILSFSASSVSCDNNVECNQPF